MNRSLSVVLGSVICVFGCTAKTANNGSTLAAGVAGMGTVLPTGTGGMTGGGVSGTGTVGVAGTGVQVSPTAGAAGHATAGTGAVAGMGSTAGKGAAGTGTAGTGSGGTGAAGSSPYDPSFKPPCLKKGADLVLIGDSYINYMENLAPRLATRAVMAGALMQGDSYSDHAVAGTSLQAGIGGLIPPQWDEAVAQNSAIKFVVMDGGGNDVLLWNMQCLDDSAPPTDACKQVAADSLATGMTLMNKIKAAGVSQVLYFFYPEIPKDPGGHMINAYAIPMIKAMCEGASDAHFQCYFLDTRPVFTDKVGDFNPLDSIHPSAQGDEKLADAVWGLMKDHCMAQAESSGCCTPQ